MERYHGEARDADRGAVVVGFQEGVRMEIGVLAKPGLTGEPLEALRGVVREWRRSGHDVWVRVAFEAGDGEAFAREAAAGRDVVVAAGGDGTVNEVVNGLLSSDGTSRLGVLPLGTANDLAVGVGVPESLEEAAGVVVGGRPMRVDAVRLNGRVFLNVSTGGVAAEATEETPAERKELLGSWAYLITALKKLGELEPVEARFETPEGVVYEGPTLFFAVANGRQTGGGNVVAPEAALDDGVVDLVVVPGLTRMAVMGLVPDLRAGRHVDREEVLHARASRVEVTCSERLAVNADGEPVEGDTYTYEVIPGALELMVV